MRLFEVFLGPGGKDKPLFSDELLKETGAQVFSSAEAELVGLEGIPDDPEGRDRLFVACSPTEERLIHTRLEANQDVASFKLHDLVS